VPAGVTALAVDLDSGSTRVGLMPSAEAH